MGGVIKRVEKSEIKKYAITFTFLWGRGGCEGGGVGFGGQKV